jgi:hypothetical protein
VLFRSSKEERTQKKQIEKELINVSQKEEESYQLIAEQIISSHIQPFYMDYLSKIGFESFRKILEMAHLFTHQINLVRNVEIAVDKASRVVFSLRCYLNVDTYSEKKVVNLEEQINKVLQIYDNYIVGKINISYKCDQVFNMNCIVHLYAVKIIGQFPRPFYRPKDTDKVSIEFLKHVLGRAYVEKEQEELDKLEALAIVHGVEVKYTEQ